MRKVLILEDRSQSAAPGYDHIFSLFSDQADSFADDYIGPSEVQSLYDVVYDSVCAKLADPNFRELFSYRGVNLLWCFKKELFHSVYWIALKWEILKRVMAKFPEGRFYIRPGTGEPDSSCFADIVSTAFAGTLPAIYLLSEPVRKKNDRETSIVRRPTDSFWPQIISFGKLTKCKTAVFSDYARSQSVLRRLSSEGCALFSNTGSIRTVFRALHDGVALFQVAWNGKESRIAGDASERSIRKLREAKIFTGTVWGDLNGGPFLERRLEQLFAAHLPRLLSEIDAMHRFFKSATQMRSALLDEDIDPSKNAFCQVARQYGVRTAVELHGALGARHGLIPLTADKMFVWGKAQKDKLVRWGCPGNKIIISGCSRYAHYQTIDEEQARQKVARALKLDASKKTVLLVFAPVNRWNSWYEHRVWRVISEALTAAEELSKRFPIQFIIKLHPAETSESFYYAWVKKYGLQDRAKVLRKYDPLLLAKAVDLLWVYGSTYAVDGFALEKPVICIDDKWDPLLEEFRPYSVFSYADTRQEIVSTATKILRDGFFRPPLWERAKQECLNREGKDPSVFIAEELSRD